MKYLIPICAGIALYSLSAIILGNTGLRAYETMLHEKEAQLENLTKLDEINAELKGARDALTYDADVIAVHARELGYGTEGERFIRISGFDKINNQRLTEGEIVRGETVGFVEDKTLRIISICAAGILFLFFAFNDLLRYIFLKNN